MDMKALAAHPVAWTEGMFLRPQHLQQQDRHWEAQLRDRVRSLDPLHWGVRALELEPEALGNHRIELRQLEVILPGGALLRYPGECVLAGREFAATAEAVDVWVGLRRAVPGAASSAPEGSATREARYRVRADEVDDANGGGEAAQIELLVPEARLFLSGEENQLEAYDAVKIARVVATGEVGRPFALAADFAPPLLSLKACPGLDGELQKVVSQLAARVRVVAGRTTTIAIADLPRMWMRYTLARTTPLLRQLTAADVARPFEVYLALLETAGALAAFETSEAVELPEYRHEEPYPCFVQVLRFIEQQLEEVLPNRFREIELRFDRKAYSTAELGMELSDPRNQFFIGVKSDVDSKELAEHVQEFGKCAAAGELGWIVVSNLQGLRMEAMPAAPTDIAARIGYQYWRLEPHGKLWGRVRSDGTLALSLGKLESAEVRLYVVLAETP
jgi:type VI secretion system protein ImpJ